MDAVGPQDVRRESRTVKPCGPGSLDAGVNPWGQEPGATVAKKPDTPGRARSSRKTIAQGVPE